MQSARSQLTSITSGSMIPSFVLDELLLIQSMTQIRNIQPKKKFTQAYHIQVRAVPR